MKADLYLVGGFLGAGKTTLLYEAASRLQGAVGLISNDQAAGLVDTELFKATPGAVREVSGSCFCCNFPGFLAAARSLKDTGCESILAEPVGSCTDLSATIAQPVKDRHAEEFQLRGLTVLADPTRLRAILDSGTSGLHKSAAYIVEKQFEEADILLISKADLLSPVERDALAARAAVRFSNAKVMCASAHTGEGVDEWLAAAGGMDGAGRRVVPVDYDTYAEGEAALGWLNLTASLSGEADWNTMARGLIDDLTAGFAALCAPVGHVKLLITSEHGYAVANLTDGASAPSVRGDAGTTGEATLTLNARVQMPPKVLETEVLKEIRRTLGGVSCHIDTLVSLTPGRPNPTYRYDLAIG